MTITAPAPTPKRVTAAHAFSLGAIGSLGAAIYFHTVNQPGIWLPLTVMTVTYAVTALALMLAADDELVASVKKTARQARFHARRIVHPYDRPYLAQLRTTAIALASLPDEWVTDDERQALVNAEAMEVLRCGGPHATLYALCFLDDVGDARAAILVDRARRAEAHAAYVAERAATQAVKAAPAPRKRAPRRTAKGAVA